MGMMLETTANRLFTEKGAPHFGSPDKDPALRLRVLEDAGRSNVPFTTGILIGIGETLAERAESIFAIRKVAREYGGIQEVIVQNFRAKPDTKMRDAPDAELDDLAATIAVTRLVLGAKARIQAPPNLVGDQYDLILRAGIDDWGGVSPLTPDHVNPERPWPDIDELAAHTARPRVSPCASASPSTPPTSASPGWIPGWPRTCGRWPTRTAGWPPTAPCRAACRGRNPTAGWGSGPRPAGPTCTSPSTPPAAPMTGAMISLRSTGTGMRLPNGPALRAPARFEPSASLRPGRPGRGRGRRGPAPGRARPGRPHRRSGPRPAVRGRSRPRGPGRPGRRLAARGRRRRRHLRRHPQYQLHQRLLHRLPVLRLRAAPDRRRRVHPVTAADR